MKQRLDHVLMERGLAGTREKARALILAGAVRVDGQRSDKPGRSISTDARVEVSEQPKYASRGGVKLEAAIRNFGVPVEGKICLDIGSSTGGFTDCLLQHGAARVHAVDVGEGQLDWRLRNDPRVVVHEGVNARRLAPAVIGEQCDLATCDVSFISVTLILPVLPACLASGGEMVILIKPQFEAGRAQVGKGGIVRDEAVQRAACDRVQRAVEELGYRTALMESPIRGAEGNREFLLYGKH